MSHEECPFCGRTDSADRTFKQRSQYYRERYNAAMDRIDSLEEKLKEREVAEMDRDELWLAHAQIESLEAQKKMDAEERDDLRKLNRRFLEEIKALRHNLSVVEHKLVLKDRESDSMRTQVENAINAVRLLME